MEASERLSDAAPRLLSALRTYLDALREYRTSANRSVDEENHVRQRIARTYEREAPPPLDENSWVEYIAALRARAESEAKPVLAAWKPFDRLFREARTRLAGLHHKPWFQLGEKVHPSASAALHELAEFVVGGIQTGPECVLSWHKGTADSRDLRVGLEVELASFDREESCGIEETDEKAEAQLAHLGAREEEVLLALLDAKESGAHGTKTEALRRLGDPRRALDRLRTADLAVQVGSGDSKRGVWRLTPLGVRVAALLKTNLRQ